MRNASCLSRLFGLIVIVGLVPLISATGWAREPVPGESASPAPANVSAQRIAQGPAKKKSDAPKGNEGPAAATEQAPEPEAWAINCSNQGSPKLTCEMTQNIVDQRSRNQIMLIALKGAGPTASGALLFRVFHGVFLPAGLAVTIDKGQPAQLPFQKSDQSGVYAALPLDDKVLADLKRGKDLKLTVQVNQGEALEIVARLAGFGPAYDKVKSLN